MAGFFQIFKDITEYARNPLKSLPNVDLAGSYILRCYAVTNPGIITFFREEYGYNRDYNLTFEFMTTENVIRGLREYCERYGGIYNPEILKGAAKSSLPSMDIFRPQIRASIGEPECRILHTALSNNCPEELYEMYYEQTAAQALKAAKVSKKEMAERAMSQPLDILFIHHNDFRAKAKKVFDTFMSYYGLTNYRFEVMNGDKNNEVTEVILKRNPKIIMLLGASACEDMGIDKDGIVNRCGNAEAHNGREYIIALSLSYVADNNDQDVYNNMGNAFRHAMEFLAPETVEDDTASKGKKPGSILADGKIYSYKGLPSKFYDPEWVLIDIAENDRFNIEHVFRNAKTGKKIIQKTANSEYDYYYIQKDIYRDYVLSGTPGQWSELLLDFKDGYEGKVTLDRLHLRAHKGLPCIRIGEGCDVTIELVGDNVLDAGGIEVHEGAKMTLQGDGDVTIKLKGNDYCGIGNANGKTGVLEFYQDGAVNIEANGMRGAAIGGGSGADIRIHSGRYSITQHGDQGVGIGCLEGDIDLVIRNCEMDLTQSYANGCAIGSFSGNASVDIQKTYIHCVGSGADIVVLGSVRGKATVKLEDMATDFDIRAQKGCGLGSIYGYTDANLYKMSYRFAGSGQEMFAYASADGEGRVQVSNSDLCIHVNNEPWKVTMLTEKDYSVKDSRYDVTVNECAPGEDARVSGLCCQ